MTSVAASIAGGVLDSVSAGILLYAATVELMVSPLLSPSSHSHCPVIVERENVADPDFRHTNSCSTHITIRVLGRGCCLSLPVSHPERD